MRITDLLAEINIEVLRLIAVNTDSKVTKNDDDMKSALKKFRSMFEAMQNKSVELNNTLSFFEKIELKRDLNALKKTMQNTRTDDRWKVFESSNMLSKMCAKYRAEYEDYVPGLEERIRKAYIAAKENRDKNGIKADNPVTTLDINEINEMAKRRAEEQEQLERVARISAAIEKKKAEQRKRSISVDENAGYESVMARKIKELLRDFDEDEAPVRSGETISIRYELQNDTYYLEGEPVLVKPKRLTTIEEKEEYIRSKLKNQSEFGFLFDTFIPDEKKALKNCDPYIIGILLSKDIKLARDYVKQLAGIPRKKTSPEDIKIIYDVRGLETGKGVYISSKERRSIRKTAIQQKNVGKVLEDRRKLPWYAAIPFVGALAVAGIAGITAANNANQNNRDVQADNSYTDTLDTETTSKTTHTTTVTTKALTTTEADQGNLYETELSTETTYTSPVETTVTSISSSEAATSKTTTSKTTQSQDNNQKSNNNTQTIETEKKDNNDSTITESNKEEKVVINIGDKISVQDGLKYTANCLGGGNCNRIGAVSWRPAAEYNIERIAFTYHGRILNIMNRGDMDVEQTLNDVAFRCGVDAEDINLSVLISLVPGTADTGWATINLSDMKQNLSKPVAEQSNTISNVNMDLDR